MRALYSKTTHYAAMQGSYWISNCVMYCYSTVFLLENGVDMNRVGLIITAVNILSVITQFLASSTINKGGRLITLRSVSCAMAALTVAASLLLALFAGKTAAFVVLMFGIINVVNIALQPLISSIAMEYQNRGNRLNFSAARGFGSVAYAAAALLLGRIISSSGTGFLPGVYSIFGACLFLSIFLFKTPAADESQITEKPGEKHGFISFLIKNPHFLGLLLGIALITIYGRIYGVYLIKIVENIGGDSSHMGIAVAFSAGSEFPCMLYFNRIVRRIKCSALLKISGVFFVLKALAIALSTQIWMLYLANSLQMFAFALFLPSLVYYINQIMSEKDRVTGQVAGVAAMTIGDILGSLIVGFIPTGSSIAFVQTIAVSICALGCVFFFLFTRPVAIDEGLVAR